MKSRKYRFFYHYRRSDGRMSVHFRGKCLTCDEVDCRVSTETKRNKIQPRLVIRGFAKSVERVYNKLVIT